MRIRIAKQQFVLSLLVCSVCLGAPLLTQGAQATESEALIQPGDHVAYIGNTMADRMQHFAWLETYLHAIYPDYELTFRNLGFPADEIAKRPRSENFGDANQWLAKCEADVVFCFFGYSEALRGPAELPKFEKQLTEMIQGMRSQQYNDESPPRLVVFSPIAHEDLESPHLPDGKQNNENLKLYTAAMQRICREQGVRFVDLFTPSQKLYQEQAQPLTLNGIHLTESGNKLIAENILEQLSSQSPPAESAQLAKLRDAILEKNQYWFSRYRVVDGFNVYGGRSKLAWHGQSNADVMRREMEVFDVMTANRDKRVWAIAQGSDLEVTDDNLPPLLEVKTNKPGPLEGGKFEYLGGNAAIDKMETAEGMQVNLFASEERFPRLVNPVQMAVDSDSRLWASVWPSYPHWNPTEPRRDALLILPDEDGDGEADECIVFADELNSVTGFEFWGGGVLVAAPPEIWFLKDTDGDDKADVKIRLLQGVSSADTHHSANAMLIGPDGWLYWSRGVFNVANFETPSTTYRSGTSGVHRFNPRTFEVEFHFPIGPNPHGDVFDRWGFQFANDGTSGQGSYVNIGKGVGNKLWFEKRVRPVAATGILSSSHFPPENEGNFLICNTIGVLGVLQHKVNYQGADITATEIEPILVSSDQNFRPVDLEVGGDGALYVADWHNVLIGHMQHNMRDPNRDHEHGRIYRVSYPGRDLLKPPKMRGKPISTLCEFLLAKENSTRYHARQELTSRESEAVVKEVGDFAASLDPQQASADRDEAQALLECLWVFAEQRVPNVELVKKVFQAEEPRVRAAAIRTLGQWGGRASDWETTLLAAARDPSALVRAEAVKAAVASPGPTAAEVVFEAAVRPLDPELETVIGYAEGQLNVPQILQEAVRSGIDLSPAARKYILAHASIDDLHQLPPSEAIFRAILARKEATVKQLDEALTSLAGITRAEKLTLLMDMLEQLPENSQDNLNGLGKLLIQHASDASQQTATRLQGLARENDSALVRRLGYAAWITAAGPDEPYLAASRKQDSLLEFLQAVPLVKAKNFGELFAKIRPLVSELPPNLSNDAEGSGNESLHDAAIAALASIPGYDQEKFSEFSAQLAAGRQRVAAIRALSALPQQTWPADRVSPLIDNLVGYLSALPRQQRTSETANQAVALAKTLSASLPGEQSDAVKERLQKIDVRVIAIGTVPHRMIYDKELIAVKAGDPVEFRFANIDAMPHNFAIVQPGALEEVGDLAEATGTAPDAIARNYIPDSDKILLASRLLQSGENQSLSFVAPTEPGVYPYVCTYPGHWRRMFGSLYVVADLEQYRADPEAYLASHDLPIKDELLKTSTRNHEWTFDELIGDVRASPPGRSFEVGKQLFKAASCVGCHKLDNEGYVFGPDLAKLDEKKHTTEYLLRSLLEPSREIEPKYQAHTFLLDSGLTRTGMIVEKSDQEIKIMIDPLAKGEPTVILTEEIEAEQPSDISPMPSGLLNRLTREEILDLIAFIYSGGNSKDSIYSDGHQHHHAH